jgi:hypothetical protein
VISLQFLKGRGKTKDSPVLKETVLVVLTGFACSSNALECVQGVHLSALGVVQMKPVSLVDMLKLINTGSCDCS